MSLGPRQTSEISAVLARVKYGLIDCPVHVAGKSGVLAALAAHGIVPIHPEGAGTFEGLEFGQDTVNISATTHASDRSAAQAPDGAAGGIATWCPKALSRPAGEQYVASSTIRGMKSFIFTTAYAIKLVEQ